MYDGTSFAKNQDVVFVTFNYRTNVFGFPTAPDLPASSNNLGFLDQELALAWVQDNIAQFGGDKRKVTIMVRASHEITCRSTTPTSELTGPNLSCSPLLSELRSSFCRSVREFRSLARVFPPLLT